MRITKLSETQIRQAAAALRAATAANDEDDDEDLGREQNDRKKRGQRGVRQKDIDSDSDLDL